MEISRNICLQMAFIIMVIAHHPTNAKTSFGQWVKVSKDGLGDYKTISEAVAAAPNNSPSRHYIKIEAGVYNERVYVGAEKQNLAFIGDTGPKKTIITGRRSVDSGLTLNATATVDIDGNDFIAMHLTITNSAGPNANKAVALRNAADRSAFYNCRFNGYQDTLYLVHGNQFFRDCKIYGSVDFIFGAAAVVFQKCNILVHNKLNSETIITAQGKEKSSQEASGFSIHNCHIQGASDLVKSSKKTFLGRPWKDSSTVVVMESTLDGIIDPKGWELWQGERPSPFTLYGDYKNIGAGSSQIGRAAWVKPGGSMTRLQAQKFTARNLIHGDKWLKATNMPFDLDLKE